MSSGLLSYTHLSARARALAGNLVTSGQWSTLLDTPDLSTFGHALAQLPYAQGKALPDSLPALELSFVRSVAAEYERFISLTGGAVRALLQELWRRFELDNLKALLRSLGHKRGEQAESLLIPLRNSVLPIDQLQEATELSAAAILLADTVYGPPLADALPRYQSEGTLFPVEVALDINYWRRVWRAVRRLTGSDKDWAQRLIGGRFDSVNIVWAFRYRIYYQLSEVEIINYTLPNGYRSDDSVLRAIAGGARVREIAAKVWGPGVPEFEGLSDEEPREALRGFEVALDRLGCRLARQPFAASPFQLGILLGFLQLKEYEAHDLTTVAESKTVGLPAERISPYLVTC